MFIGSSRYKALGTRVSALLDVILADSANLRQLELRFAVVTLEASLNIVQRL